MHSFKKLSSLGLIGAAVAAAIATAPVRAQSATQPAAAPPSEEIDEVIVTARRRSESFKDVPITINVFTREAVEAALQLRGQSCGAAFTLSAGSAGG